MPLSYLFLYTSFKQQSFRILPSNELFKYAGINRGKWFLFKLLFVNIGLDAINMGNVLEISVNSQFVLNFKAPIAPIMAGTYITPLLRWLDVGQEVLPFPVTWVRPRLFTCFCGVRVLHALTFLVPCCDACPGFRVKTIFSSYLLSFVL